MNQIMSSEKSTSIEMRNASNIYPIIRGEISETDAQAQPCDTQTISSYHDIDETNSDNEMLKAQPLKPRVSVCEKMEKKLSRQLTKSGGMTSKNQKVSTTSFATNSALAGMFNTVITTAGFTSVHEREAISNTVWFLSEHNNNFEPDVVDSEELVCPSNDNINLKKGCNSLYLRWLAKRIIHHIAFRIMTVLLIILDVALVITALALECRGERPEEGVETTMAPLGILTTLPDKNFLPSEISNCIDIKDPVFKVISVVDLCISTFFILEVAMRMYAMTPTWYFSTRYWFNTLDFVIVVIGFVGSLIEIVLIYTKCAEGNCGLIGVVKVITFLRGVRIVKLFRIVRIYTEHHQLKRSMRQFVSQNKQRWVQGEFDLDLTYVTKNVIGMSFPSKGMMAWYRNSIKDVANFMDKTHGIGNYRLYNLCSERGYDYEKFHNQVEEWPIGDHNVPTVKQMVDFVAAVNAWLSKDDKNVAAIHCKGGKGRTGTMICILLIHRGLFRGAKETLNYFGQRRTDTAISQQFQGVETASQIRYVTYYEKLLSMPCTYPDIVSLKIESIHISGLSTVGRGDGTDLSLTVHVGQNLAKKIYEAQIWNDRSKLAKVAVQSTRVVRSISQTNTKNYCESHYSSDEDLLRINMSCCPSVSEDVRLQFHCSSNKVPRGYESCAFYFWFHTAFLDQIPSATGKKKYQLKLSREEIDNPHKSKTWNTYREDFAIEMLFTEVD